ncbi:MAG TPA: LLM class flavin-dependent oxidoreductase [Mycobacteriales bacterium]|nr:LLM class flavin-dependent oxidoreductase [Mycobacteriales bacterium]
MRLGVQLPEVERFVRWPEYLAMAKAAEESGFGSIWLGDHLLYRDDGREERGPWDAWSLLAALAAATRSVRLGPLVSCTAFGPPWLLARRAAAVQEISEGRLVLGLGAGWNETEFRAFGVPYDRRGSRFVVAFEEIRRLLAGERVTTSSDAGGLHDAVLLPRPGTPPALMVGSTGERVLRATLPHVDGWNIWYDWFGNAPDGFARENDRVTSLLRDVGRAPAEVWRSATVLVALDDTRSSRPISAETPPVSGSAERITEQLQAFAAAGVDEAILVLSPITEKSIRALAPVVAALT